MYQTATQCCFLTQADFYLKSRRKQSDYHNLLIFLKVVLATE